MKTEKYQNVMMYQIMVFILKSWFHEHIISSDEYRRMNTILAEKYGLNSYSIFLDFSAVQR